MTRQTEETYYDLHITGIGYLNRARSVPLAEQDDLLAVDIKALHGRSDKVQSTRFDCTVVGHDAKRIVVRLMPAITVGKTVLVGFKLSGLTPETFTYQKGERLGETGINLKAQLLKIAWVKVDGNNVELATLLKKRQAETA